ncbi:hypothetical protein M3Y97_00300800 [Aphelenchoides bicaudatus]|nr:hypothetical protein M3Y97_00300800 [Aphelenchoides bicaudatus]
MNISLEVPTHYKMPIRLLDGETEIGRFPIPQIRCCTCGLRGKSEQECIAFSFTQRLGTSNETHQCHVFRCQSAQIVGQMLQCFHTVFASKCPNGPSTSINEAFEFEMRLEIREADDVENGYSYCPVETNCFKLRKDRKRRVVAVLKQMQGPRDIRIRKCFGVLLAAGRYLRESDLQLLDSQEFKQVGESNEYEISAPWNPRARNFEVLNIETPRETRAFMTVAVDVILDDVDESLRFSLECRARVLHQNENFLYAERMPVVEKFYLNLLVADGKAKITSFESAAQRQRTELNGKPLEKMPVQLIHPMNDDESDSDEPLLSGSGTVEQECNQDVLKAFEDLIDKWKQNLDSRPPELAGLIQAGVPDAVRGQIWILLAKAYNDEELIKTYHSLLDKESLSEQVILRDIHRTFPAHEYFKQPNGKGQESLYKISKAYSLYDEEVGYCQGLSFLAAALLLHMDDEQAFCVLVRIMFDYELRDLFKLGFDSLHLRFYQLQKLIEDYIPDLNQHFMDNNVETHQFASQWFLTLFTAKFHLQMVFFVIDLFLTEGVNTIFHVALALLQDSKKDLLMLDFEGILKYFRVTLPRKYRTDKTARELINSAVKLKISHKRLNKYEQHFRAAKQSEIENLDPVVRLERELAKMKAAVLRLERENDDLARELVTSKINLRNRLDETEDKLEYLTMDNQRRSKEYKELQEENNILKEQSVLLKQLIASSHQHQQQQNQQQASQ